MPKRLLIFAIALLAAVGGFWLYRSSQSGLRWSGPQSESSEPIAPSDTAPEGPDESDMIPVSPDAAIGELRGTHFQSRDLKGDLINEFGFAERLGRQSGQLEFRDPWVKFYDRSNGTVLHVTAARLSTPADFGQDLPDTGRLSGNVRIRLYPFDPNHPNETTADPGTEVLRAEMDVIDFQRELSRMSSDGTIRLVHPDMELLGSQFSLQYDQVNRQLQELQIIHIDRIDIAANLMSAAEENKPMATPVPAEQKPGEQTTSSAPSRQIYQIALTRDIDIEHSPQRIRADQLRILLDTGALRKASKVSSESAPDSSSPTTPKVTPPQTTIDRIRLTCAGPLRVLPATPEQQQQLPADSAYDLRLIGNPLTVEENDQLVTRSGQIEFTEAGRTLKMLPFADNPIDVSLPDGQSLTARREIRFRLTARLGTLAGPGILTGPPTNQTDPIKVAYQDRIDFAYLNDPNLPLQWLQFSGPLVLTQPHSEVRANRGRLDFFHRADFEPLLASAPFEPRMQIKTLDLTEQVFIHHQDNIITTQRLQGSFHLQSDGRAEPNVVTASGITVADLPDYHIAADKVMQLTFRDASTETANTSEVGTNDFDWLGQESLQNVLGEGSDDGVAVDFHKQKLHISGSRLTGDVPADVWTINGSPARIRSSDPNESFEELTGPTIIVDQPNGLFTIPGAGSLTARMNADLTGWRNRTVATTLPAVLQWNNSAGYYMADNQALFNDVILTVQEQKSRATRCTWLFGPMLEVTLAGPIQAAEVVRLQAHGPDLRIESEEYAPDHTVIHSLNMQLPQLDYDLRRQALSSAGQGVVALRTFAAANSESPAPQPSQAVDLTLRRSLAGSNPGYTQISFAESLTYAADKGDIRLRGDVRLSQLPEINGEIPTTTDETGAPAVEDMMLLFCDELNLRVPPLNRPNESDTGPTSSESFDLQAVQATGDVVFQTQRDGQKRIIYAPQMAYDQTTGDVHFRGTPDQPVRLDQSRFLELTYNRTTGRLRAKPIGQSEWVIP